MFYRIVFMGFMALWMSVLFSVRWLEWNTSFYMLRSPFFLSFGSNSGSPLPKVKCVNFRHSFLLKILSELYGLRLYYYYYYWIGFCFGDSPRLHTCSVLYWEDSAYQLVMPKICSGNTTNLKDTQPEQ